MLTLTEPRLVQRDPTHVVGAYRTYVGDDEGPGWSGAYQEFTLRRFEITNRVNDAMLGFLYRPHRDHPGIPQSVRACFIGVEVEDLCQVPEGMAATHFSGGPYVVVACRGDTQDEASIGVGEAVELLERWLPEHGYEEGDACFASSDELTETSPYIENVYMRAVEKS